MSIWNKILIGLIFVGAIAFFILSARALKTHQVWRQSAVQHEEALAQAKDDLVLVQEGDEEAETPSIRALELELHARMLDRGRAWYNVTPLQVTSGKDPNSGADTVVVSVKPDQPDPHRIAAQTVLFVFDGRPFDQGGRYLGQFTVTNVVENGPVQLQPSMTLGTRETDRLKASRGPWTLYEAVPKDEEAVFADLTEAEIQALFPGASQQEYLQEEERKLRDYEVLFAEYALQWTVLTDRLNAVQLDNQYLQGALTNAEAQEQKKQKEIDDAKQELAALTKQRDAVASHLAALQRRLGVAEKGVADLIQRNQVLAAELARMQADVINRVDQRTREMAQAGAP